MPKLYNRTSTFISRDTDAVESSEKTPSWFNDFLSNLDKIAVEPRKNETELEQISNILGKSKYSNVEEAVLDMSKRTGLYEMLNKKANIKEPEIFKDIPEMKTFIDNYVNDRPGIAVEAVVHALMKINSIKNKLNENDAPEEVKRYINDKIIERKSMSPIADEHSSNIGRFDSSFDENNTSDDPFASCMPTKK